MTRRRRISLFSAGPPPHNDASTTRCAVSKLRTARSAETAFKAAPHGQAATPNYEGYELTVAPDSVVVRGPTSDGVFYGVQSLLQLLPPEVFSGQTVSNVAWTVPCVYIFDQPQYHWRGAMLDVARHFIGVNIRKLAARRLDVKIPSAQISAHITFAKNGQLPLFTA